MYFVCYKGMFCFNIYKLELILVVNYSANLYLVFLLATIF